ncbi:hypothetical protein ONE63_000063 [Megalurothrips usitatus]|uniref:Peptidase S1 domain-containing protein n=1 Tax=Megalurothrips usitatus TaxID=439358 RepID=A0AAV7Y454_9NEOP|nr:hypothetical protein ONE63_000063 [Megalurothrips usitatus]
MAQVCGGSLITTKYFVSAAHCFHDNKNQLPATRYMAAFGRTKRDVKIEEPNVQYKEVEKLHLPKDYGGRRLQYANDIALAELRDEVDVTAWAMPVCMDWGLELPPLLSGEEGTVIGFGDLPERPSEELRFARLPFVRGDVCKKKVVDSLAVFTLIPDKFCVGFVNRTTVAKGDSGGGLSFPNEDRKWFLRGVVSVGSSQQTTFSYFTNVTAFVPWISAIINHGEVSGRRCGVDVHERVAADGQAAAREAFPWEVDVYYKGVTGRDATFNSPVWTGVLVKPNLVIAPTLLYKTEHRNLDLSKYPAQWITVAARVRTADGLPAKVGARIPVVRSFVPDDVQQQTGVPYNFLLLELEESLNLMPACLDWSGGALLQKRKTGTVSPPPSDHRIRNSDWPQRTHVPQPTVCCFEPSS